jgi:hypothetical protein
MAAGMGSRYGGNKQLDKIKASVNLSRLFRIVALLVGICSFRVFFAFDLHSVFIKYREVFVFLVLAWQVGHIYFTVL